MDGRTGRIRLDALFFLPFTGGFFGGLVANLFDFPFGPFLLVFLLAALKIVRDALVNDLVADLELVPVGIAWCHSWLLSKDGAGLDRESRFVLYRIRNELPRPAPTSDLRRGACKGRGATRPLSLQAANRYRILESVSYVKRPDVAAQGNRVNGFMRRP